VYVRNIGEGKAMITKWGLKNFKSIREAELELAPLTILTGVNSSGKSSFLQSIVMLVQTTKYRNNTGGITFKGEDGEDEKILIDLGEFKDILCNNPCKFTSEDNKDYDDSNIYVAFTVSSDEYEFIHYEFAFCKEYYVKGINFVSALHMECKKKDEDIAFINLDLDEQFKPISLLESGNKLDPASEKEIRKEHHKNVDLYGSSVRNYRNHFLPLYISFYVGKVDDEDIDDVLTMLIELLSCDTKLNDDSRLFKIHNTKHDLGRAFIYAMAEEIFGIIDTTLLSPESKELLAVKSFDFDGEAMARLFYLSKLDEQERKIIIDELRKDDLITRINERFSSFGQKVFINTEYIDLPSALSKATSYLYDIFDSGIKYLGPLREDPKWKYKTMPLKTELDLEGKKNIVLYIDPKGKNTAAAINYLNAKRVDVKNYFSPSNLDTLDNSNLPKRNFSVALVEWLNYINLSDNFRTNELGTDNFDIKLIIDDFEFAIPQLGTGVSQVLPILTICLSAEPGSTIIIQEPEAHLHPKVQSRLADFFIAMALSGRQCIIETHSEYLIEQLNYRILKSPFENPSHEKIKVYFVTKINGESQFKDMDINEFGAPSDWPEDFFDESHLIARKKMKEYKKKWKEYNERRGTSIENE
jgi:predicted ATPase